MLYLEDYLEVIENLPMEMRDRLTEMREMDLQVQNALDNLDDKVSAFFKKCTQPNSKNDWREEQFTKLKQGYYKVLDDADEKVHLASHIHDLVDRHLRKLDQELSKFKMELEADNAGITEILEKRSLELDTPQQSQNRPDKRRMITPANPTQSYHNDKQISTERVLSTLANEVAKESIGPRRMNTASNTSAAVNSFNSGSSGTSQAGITYSLGHMCAGSNAVIAAAASQAIAATQQTVTSGRSFVQKNPICKSQEKKDVIYSETALQMNKLSQGRRTPSMKASIVAMSRSADLAKELSFKEIAFNANTNCVPSPAPVESTSSGTVTTPRAPRSKKRRITKQSKAAAVAAAAAAAAAATATSTNQQTQVSAALQAAVAAQQAAVAAQQQVIVQQVAVAAAAVPPLQPPPVQPAPTVQIQPSPLVLGTAPAQAISSPQTGTEDYSSELQIVDENGQPVDWQDPNEPRYCVCNNVSYGDMVGCDNDDCPMEWFHYGCVGLTQAPKGKWYCHQCTISMKRRSRR